MEILKLDSDMDDLIARRASIRDLKNHAQEKASARWHRTASAVSCKASLPSPKSRA